MHALIDISIHGSKFVRGEQKKTSCPKLENRKKEGEKSERKTNTQSKL